MSIEIPYDLIKQVQTAVLNETNFLKYDPDDVSFPDLPSFEDCISELDSSPLHFRCKHCKGRFLRGENSLVCVFCGNQRAPQEAPPEPINFRTTFGCRWLLDSLGLDGSETVALPMQENELNRGQNATQEEIRLSDLLDLEITWNSEFDRLGTDKLETDFHFTGTNFDNTFTEAKPDDVSAVSEEQSLPMKNDNGSGSDDFQVRNVDHLFEKVQNSDTAVEFNSVMDSFGGWEANFQSAGPGTGHEESKSFSPVMGSPIDLSTQMDEVFGSGNFSGKDKEELISSGSRSKDWVQDDQFNSFRSGTSGNTKQVELTANEMNDRAIQNPNNASTMSADWNQDGLFNSESNKTPDDKIGDKLDDSSDTWNDFATSTTAEHPSHKLSGPTKQCEETVIVKDGGKVENLNGSSRNVNWFQDDRPQTISTVKQDNKAIDEDIDAFGDWNDFASSTTAQDPFSGQTSQTKQLEIIENVKDGKITEYANGSSSLNVDWFQDYVPQTNYNKVLDDTTNVAGDLFDAWNDFTSSTSAQGPSDKPTDNANLFEVTTNVMDGGNVEIANNPSIALIQDDQWPTFDKKKRDREATDEGNDLFDTWNDFTSSTTGRQSTKEHFGQAKELEVNSNMNAYGIMQVSTSSFDFFQGEQVQTSSNESPDSKVLDRDRDSFDAWNDFTSSTSTLDPSSKLPVNHVTPDVEQKSELKPSAANNLHNVDFGSLLEPVIFPGESSNHNGSSEVNIMKSEASIPNRIQDMNAKNGVIAGEAAEGRDILSETKSSTDVVETLMSQMHDLSFMLAGDLAIPPKHR